MRRPDQTTKQSSDAVLLIQEPQIMTVNDVAELLQIPKSSVYEKTRERRGSVPPLPVRRVGKYLRFTRSEVIDWFNSLPNRRGRRAA